eukprot:TRINITY_DN3111_c0_g1_i1.p1 TRINITY_DN3111_c0_g1~~TRINITY_DN3111_c0_g1_i1.p1  ORF type:complete len:519 (+),score=152.85 TRINITY_DN3111_c0_g1_i1:107-1558(+)
MHLLPPAPLPECVVEPPDLDLVPSLKHDLSATITTPGVHRISAPLISSRSKHEHEPKYIKDARHIHQPDEIAMEHIPPFITSSNDPLLRQYCVEHQCKFRASTSSTTGALSLIYLMLSNYRPPHMECLSADFQNMRDQWTKTMTKSTVLMLRYDAETDTYAVDSESGSAQPGNQILLTLGKTLERMLTMEREEFEKTLVRAHITEGTPRPEGWGVEAYNFWKKGSILLRSQLDCKDESLPGTRKTFDLKTRATVGVRINPEGYKSAQKQQLQSIKGVKNSFEREFYDLGRSALLKYSFQVRIGNMHGVFVAYHNTKELFGFEYISLEEMDRILFGSSFLGQEMFERGMRVYELLLEHVALLKPARTTRMTLQPNRNKQLLEVFLETVPNDSGWTEGGKEAEDEPNPSNELSKLVLSVRVFVNNNRLSGRTPLELSPGDKLDIYYQLEDMTPKLEKAMLKEEYAAALKNNGNYAGFQPKLGRRQ